MCRQGIRTYNWHFLRNTFPRNFGLGTPWTKVSALYLIIPWRIISSVNLSDFSFSPYSLLISTIFWGKGFHSLKKICIWRNTTVLELSICLFHVMPLFLALEKPMHNHSTVTIFPWHCWLYRPEICLLWSM